MTHNTDPGVPFPESDLHFEHAGSRICLYNTQDIATSEPGTRLRLYEGTELAGDMQLITLDAAVVSTDGGPALATELTIQLADQASWLTVARDLQQYVEEERPERGYLTHPTTYGNILDVELGFGMRALAWFDGENGRLTVSNHVTLGAEEADGGNGVFRADPVLLEQLGAGMQLMALSRFMADVLGGDRGHSPSPARWEYRIGERLQVLSRPEVSVQLGVAAVAASELDSPAPLTDEEILTAVERELAASIDDTVYLDEVAGNAEVKKLLSNVALSFNNPAVLAQWGARRPQGVLLHGDPGVGKTMLIQALANEIGAELREVQGADIYDKWLGNSEANIKRLFAELRAVTKPTILFIDEIEAVIGVHRGPSSGADNARNGVAAIFKRELNDLARQNPNVLIAAATNDLDAIDPSIIRSGRFDHVIEVSLPGQAALGELFATNIARRSLQLETNGFRMFTDDVHTGVPAFAAAAKAKDLSGADVVEIFRRLCFERAMHQARTGLVQAITQADLLGAIAELE